MPQLVFIFNPQFRVNVLYTDDLFTGAISMEEIIRVSAARGLATMVRNAVKGSK